MNGENHADDGTPEVSWWWWWEAGGKYRWSNRSKPTAACRFHFVLIQKQFRSIDRFGMARLAYLRFWYHVFTCVSDRFRRAANSIRSCTLRYFCRSKLCSREVSCWSVKAVRALRAFLLVFSWFSFVSRCPLSELLDSSSRSESESAVGLDKDGRLDWARMSVMKNDVGHRRLFVIVSGEKTKVELEAMRLSIVNESANANSICFSSLFFSVPSLFLGDWSKLSKRSKTLWSSLIRLLI